MKNPFHFLLHVSTQAILVWTLTADAAHSQESSTTEVGWDVTCLTDRVCELKTEITQNNIVAARVSVFRARGHYWLQYTIPLGVDLKRGVQIAIDEKVKIPTTLDNCTIFGCTGQMDLGPDVVDSLKEGSALNIYFVNPTVQETFVIQFSLTGFTSGFRELTQ